MMTFVETYIDPPNVPRDPATKRVRIAVLDTGLRVDAQDDFLRHRVKRVTMQKNFVEERSGLGGDCIDTDSHGTHVVRLLLKFAPQADILVVKVSSSRTMGSTTMNCLVKVAYTKAISS